MIKTAANPFSTIETARSESEQGKASTRGWAKYAMVLTLLLIAYASFAWLPSAPAAAEINIGVGFLAFWVLGALVTITLVALSGRSKS